MLERADTSEVSGLNRARLRSTRPVHAWSKGYWPGDTLRTGTVRAPMASVRGIGYWILLVFAAAAISAPGADWPAWRGPEGSGVSLETNLPLHWSTNQHLRWSVPLPGPGNSTPIVWGDKVFITQAIVKDHLRRVMCFNRRDGALLWQAGTVWAEKEQGGESNPPCSPSPVTDGERVIAWFGSAGVFCYDLVGQELWRDLGHQSHVWGYAASPVLDGDLCFVNVGPGPHCFVTTLEKKTGKTVWQHDVPPIGPDAKWEDFAGTLDEWKQLGSPKVADVFVLRASTNFTCLATNSIGGEKMNASLAVSNGDILLRTHSRLWCIAERADR
jgi:hypothetical protein